MLSRPSLHQSLHRSLQSVPTLRLVPRTFELTTLCTKPFRTYTLFPHALDPTIAIMRTDYLIMLAERFEDPRPVENRSSQPKTTVPVFALEASLYTITTTAVQLLYVSKIDTTGLAPLPAPAGQLTIAFLSHFLHYLPKSIRSLRIHIFARAAREGQYLFPCSAENLPGGTGDGPKFNSKLSTSPGALAGKKTTVGKRILDDQQLVKWWHRILSKLVIAYDPVDQLRNRLDCFYILPGFDYQESLQVLPVPDEIRSIWNYGHPYNKISNPFSSNSTNPSIHHDLTTDRKRGSLLSELIPAFNDDPKARFLHSIGNCSTNPSGEPGDWDDAIVERSSNSLENDRNRERLKINQISPDEFWDRMGGRQECCDGRVSAFFVIGLTPSTTNSMPDASSVPSQAQKNHDSSRVVSHNPETDRGAPVPSNLAACDHSLSNRDEAPKPLVGISRNIWVSLWSKIHNKDYSKLESSSVGYSSWVEDVKSSIDSAILQNRLWLRKTLNTNHDDTDDKKVEQFTTHEVPSKQADGPDDLSSKFENCHSTIFVDNSLLDQSTAAEECSSKLGSSDHHDHNGQKRPQVNVLQPRKKSRK